MVSSEQANAAPNHKLSSGEHANSGFYCSKDAILNKKKTKRVGSRQLVMHTGSYPYSGAAISADHLYPV